MDKNELKKMLNDMHLLHPEELAPKAKELFNAIMQIADERDKYRLLYENEKSHSETLEKIIDKILSSNKDRYIYKYVKDNEFFQPPYKITCSTTTHRRSAL